MLGGPPWSAEGSRGVAGSAGSRVVENRMPPEDCGSSREVLGVREGVGEGDGDAEYDVRVGGALRCVRLDLRRFLGLKLDD